MATFTCEKHLAACAAAAGFKVTPSGVEEHPFRVHLGAEGKAAKRLKRKLFAAAFVRLGHASCCGFELRAPAAAAAIFDLT